MTLKHAGQGLTSVGKKREHNEDSFLVDDALGLYAVADGMGGHAAGEVASRMAIEIVTEQVKAGQEVLWRLQKEANHDNKLAAQQLIEKAIQEACARIHKTAQGDRSKRGMGTTFDCVVVAGNRAVLGHVGDSRVYLIRQGKVHRLTEDHTMLAMALKAGIGKKEDFANSDWANSLTRAVGPQPSVQVDTLLLECQAGDRFFLCSDGLHGYLSDEEAPHVIASLASGTPLSKLIELANDRGGKDNITGVMVALHGDPSPTLHTIPLDTKMGLLEKIPLFAFLNYKERAAIFSIINTRNFSTGTEILREGSPGEDLYILTQGRVSVEKAGQRIGELAMGAYFGEMGLVDNAPRSATVRALEPTECMVITRSDMMNMMRREQMMAVKLLWSFVQTLSERLRNANTGMVEARKFGGSIPFNPQD
ncbi:MAG: protein phosphatase 2C domain-containing protein [Myxococcales bacterium]|nr:protein phosphatase 2C domain-containing protein [Polyangiaceae bacterium]MDW8247982.1 protein phosphatase 2C domain-containing protein [Myxococcales bacterium]